MPKKTRKAKMRAAQRPLRVGYPVGPVVPTGEPVRDPIASRAVGPSSAFGRGPIVPSFDYRYVYQDLRRIGLFAATFFALMLIIWFVVEVQGIHIIPGLF